MTGAPQPRPLPSRGHTPLPPGRPPSTRPSGESRRATGRHTDRRTDTRPQPRPGRQPPGASSSARAMAPVRGRGQTNGPAAGCRERQRQKETKLLRQTARLREGDADRQTDRHDMPRLAHTHLSVGLGDASVLSCSAVPNSDRPMDCGPSGSSVRSISQARILEWVAISFSRAPSRPRDPTRVSCRHMPSHPSQDPANSLVKMHRKDLVCYKVER